MGAHPVFGRLSRRGLNPIKAVSQIGWMAGSIWQQVPLTN